MRVQLHRVDKLVEETLRTYPDTRNSDALLYLVVCKTLVPNSTQMTLERVMLQRNELGLPNYETVGRCRRRIQAKNEELRADSKVTDVRYENYKEYRDYALS